MCQLFIQSTTLYITSHYLTSALLNNAVSTAANATPVQSCFVLNLLVLTTRASCCLLNWQLKAGKESTWQDYKTPEDRFSYRLHIISSRRKYIWSYRISNTEHRLRSLGGSSTSTGEGPKEEVTFVIVQANRFGCLQQHNTHTREEPAGAALLRRWRHG